MKHSSPLFALAVTASLFLTGCQPSLAPVTTKNVTWNGKGYSFIQSCDGQVKVGKLFGGAELVNFCLGKNVLTLVGPDEKSTVLSEITETDVLKVPVFLGADLLPASSDGTVLLSYGAESCTTTAGTPQDECGAGMPTNYVSMAVRLSNATSRDIKNYPGLGAPIWNSTATKALFIPDTCGGAGCDLATLGGYDLSADSFNEKLTQETGVGMVSPNGTAKSADGKNLAYWKSAAWTSNDQFTAVIVGADGKEKVITGIF